AACRGEAALRGRRPRAARRGASRRDRRVSGDDAGHAGQRRAGHDSPRQPADVLIKMRRAFFLPVLVVAAWLQTGALARAQQRPLTTEEPEVIGDGRLLIEAGVETGSNAWYPLSGLHGDR